MMSLNIKVALCKCHLVRQSFEWKLHWFKEKHYWTGFLKTIDKLQNMTIILFRLNWMIII